MDFVSHRSSLLSDVHVSSLVQTFSTELSRANPRVVSGLRALGEFSIAIEPGAARPSRRSLPVVHGSISLAIGYLESLATSPTPEKIAREQGNGKLSDESRLYIMALGGVQQRIAAVMQKALTDSEHDERILAIRRLAELGPAAKEAIPALQAALMDSDWLVRREALAALRKITAAPAQPTP